MISKFLVVKMMINFSKICPVAIQWPEKATFIWPLDKKELRGEKKEKRNSEAKTTQKE